MHWHAQVFSAQINWCSLHESLPDAPCRENQCDENWSLEYQRTEPPRECDNEQRCLLAWGRAQRMSHAPGKTLSISVVEERDDPEPEQ
jgi:hypothetical protein